MNQLIKIIGTLKNITLKSKVGEDNRVIHHANFSVEITDGEKEIQNIVESLKQLISIEFKNVQPKLDIPSTLPYKDDAEEGK